MDHLLTNLPNGGAVVAIVAVVVIFLRYQERRDNQTELIVKHFLDEVAVSRREYLDQIERIVGPRPPKPR